MTTVLAGCNASTGAEGPNTPPTTVTTVKGQGGSVVVASDGTLGSLDPALATQPLARAVAFATCTPLLTYADAAGDAGRTLVPGLATDMPDSNPSMSTFTFSIRSGLKFSDGTPLTTADIRYTFERLLRPAMHSPAAPLFADLVGAQAYQMGISPKVRGIVISGHGVSFHLKAGDPSFLARVALTATCPVKQGTPVADQGPALLRHGSSGPYRVARVGGGQVVLVRNPYYAAESMGPRGFANRIVVRSGVDPAELRAGLASGKVDLALDSTGQLGDGPAGSTETTEPGSTLGVLAIDQTVAPFESTRVRQAVNLAVDRAALAQALGGPRVATPASDYLPPTFTASDPAGDYPTHADVARAHERLLQSGSPLPVRASLAVPPGDSWQAIGRLVRDQLDRAGFRVKLLPRGSHEQAALRLRTYTPAYFDPEAPVAALVTGTAREPGTLRPQRLLDPRLDRALRRARRSVAPARTDLFARLAGQLGRELAPVAVLWHANFQAVASSRLDRMVAHPIYLVDLPALEPERR